MCGWGRMFQLLCFFLRFQRLESADFFTSLELSIFLSSSLQASLAWVYSSDRSHGGVYSLDDSDSECAFRARVSLLIKRSIKYVPAWGCMRRSSLVLRPPAAALSR